jgi:hypothetical protein
MNTNSGNVTAEPELARVFNTADAKPAPKYKMTLLSSPDTSSLLGKQRFCGSLGFH